MLKKLTVGLSTTLALLALSPTSSHACLSSGAQIIQHYYTGAKSINLRTRFGLQDDRCAYRQIRKVIMTASSPDSGRASLIVNGKIEGLTQLVPSSVRQLVFTLDPEHNLIGDIDHFEIRLAGTHYIESVEVVYVDESPQVFRSAVGTNNYFGVTGYFPWQSVSDTIFIRDYDQAYRGVDFYADEDDVYVDRAICKYDDGYEDFYGPFTLKRHQHRNFRFSRRHPHRRLRSVEVIGRRLHPSHRRARVRVRGIH